MKKQYSDDDALRVSELQKKNNDRVEIEEWPEDHILKAVKKGGKLTVMIRFEVPMKALKRIIAILALAATALLAKLFA